MASERSQLSNRKMLEHEFIEEWFSGYVGVPRNHPYGGKQHDQVKIDIHGGLTFSQLGSDDPPWKDKNLWWFGFHCAHNSDTTERQRWSFERPRKVRPWGLPLHTWTISEICVETTKLADQLATVQNYAQAVPKR